MTFSLVAKCEKTNMFGVAISSSSPAVASRCAFTRSGVGAVASQNVTDPTLGSKTLDYIQKGLSAKEAVEEKAEEVVVEKAQETINDALENSEEEI